MIKRKLFSFLSVLLVLTAFGCNTNTKGGENNPRPDKETAPTIKKLEVFKMDGTTSLFSIENPKDSKITATATQEESVKVKVTADSGVNITYDPALTGTGKDEFALGTVGKNTLKITLTKGALKKEYTLEIERTQIIPPSNKLLKNVKVGTGALATWQNAKLGVATTNPDEYAITFEHSVAGQKYSLFVEAESATDVVFIKDFTKKPPYPKADKSDIRDIADLPAVGGNDTLEFYLFEKEEDVSNLTLGRKYTVKLTVMAEPNTKIKTITFNNNTGIINEGNKKITCETEFDIGTVINTVVTLEDATGQYKIVDDAGKEITLPLTIAVSGLKFNIAVIPQAGEAFKATYYVTLQAKKAQQVKIITGIKYLDGSTSSETDLKENADRGDNNICEVSYSGDNNLTFLPMPKENISLVEEKVGNSYNEIPKVSGFFVIQKRSLYKLNAGMTVRVTFKDGKTDEFIIKKK